MKNSQAPIIILLFIVFTFPQLGSTQSSLTDVLNYEVNKIYPYISITKEKLEEAHTLIDLDPAYKAAWVKEYISVDVSACYKGSIITATSKNETLTQEQKDIMNRADTGTNISVSVQYMPDNTLTYNDSKEINFSFNVTPDTEARYPHGEQQLKQYIKEQAIDKIPNGSFEGYDLSVVKFTINEEGKIIDAHLFEPMLRTAKDEKIDGLLLEAIANMPRWSPAEYANGTKVKQDFVLTVGNMENCIVHLLNIRRD